MITHEAFLNNGFVQNENGYIIRISDLIWCEIDCYGFATLKRKRENANVRQMEDLITIPHPKRSEQDLKDLLIALVGCKLELK